MNPTFFFNLNQPMQGYFSTKCVLLLGTQCGFFTLYLSAAAIVILVGSTAHSCGQIGARRG